MFFLLNKCICKKKKKKAKGTPKRRPSKLVLPTRETAETTSYNLDKPEKAKYKLTTSPLKGLSWFLP